MLFTNAHCQAPICNPSRTSFILGLRPSTTGIYQNSPWFRSTAANKNRISLTQYFGAHGYETQTAGKIFHGSRVDGPSFEIVGERPGQRLAIDKQLVSDIGSKFHLWDYGAQTYPEEKFVDHVVADWAIKSLGEKKKKPFFLAAGFYRPHVPTYAPLRFFDRLPLEGINLPPYKASDRSDLSTYALDLVANSTPPPHEWWVKSGQWDAGVQAYLASASFTDFQVGRVLDALDKSPHALNTIIVLLSDHGFHSGEKNVWAKRTLWERSTRVPLIVSVPGRLRPGVCFKPVELLGIFPTLVELCELPTKKDLDGASLVPLLDAPKTKWAHPAITTMGKNNHSVRSEHFRFIRYSDGSEELYDHPNDPNEWDNLAGSPKYAEVIERHAKWFPKNNVPDAASSSPRKPNRKPKT